MEDDIFVWLGHRCCVSNFEPHWRHRQTIQMQSTRTGSKETRFTLQVLTGLLPIFNDSAFVCFSYLFLRFWSSKTFFATQVSSRRLNLPSSWALQPGDVPSCPERMLGVPTTAFLSPGWWISMDLWVLLKVWNCWRNLRSNVTVLIVLLIFENQTNGASR